MVLSSNLFCVQMKLVVSTAVMLPLLSIFICIFLSFVNNFDSVTWTHCNVPNFFPSISTVIGNYTPQKYIWRIGVALHVTPRLLFATVYYNYYSDMKHVVEKHYLFGIINRVACLCHISEIFCLLGLTCVSSTENFEIHRNCFIGFGVFSFLYMLLSCLLSYWPRLSKSLAEHQSAKRKVLVFSANVSSFALLTYFYWRHNKYCEPYVYSFFATFEYAVILTNMAFHSLAIGDFGKKYIVLLDGGRL